MKVFGDCFKQKTAHNSVFSSFSAWGDPSFAEVKNSSSFKKQAPIFLEQKTWDFSTILSKLGSPKPGGKSLNLTKKVSTGRIWDAASTMKISKRAHVPTSVYIHDILRFKNQLIEET